MFFLPGSLDGKVDTGRILLPNNFKDTVKICTNMLNKKY